VNYNNNKQYNTVYMPTDAGWRVRLRNDCNQDASISEQLDGPC